MINENNIFLTESWLSGCYLQRSLSAQMSGGPDANTDWGKAVNFCGQGLKRFPW